MYHSDYSIYYGDILDGLDNQIYLSWRGEFLLNKQPFQRIMDQNSPQDLMFLHQIHSADGLAVSLSDRATHSFISQGDFLITNTPRFGIGVMTADCMPIACFDKRTGSIGIAHAGWRGLFAGVVPAMIAALKETYGTNIQDLVWHVGPSARGCCYQVGQEFLTYVDVHDREKVIRQADGACFFDGVAYLKKQLEKCGVESSRINDQNAMCTICTSRYFSYRRSCQQGTQNTYRNMTVISLL